MMIGNSRKGNHQGKQEGDSDDHHYNIINNNNGIIGKYLYPNKVLGSSSSWASRQWSLRNPRIVQVSRAFGGKDRHSKVCTIRGLRDRRIRLSMPTAVQLYELQDRLGLSQPSKVIDWLIEATKADIDKLPPLQFPHGFPHQFLHPKNLISPPQIHLSNSSLNINYDHGSNFIDHHERLSLWDQKGKWVMKTNNEDDDGGIGENINNNNSVENNYYSRQYSSNNLSLFGSHGGLFFPDNSNSQVDPALPHNSSSINNNNNNSVQFQFPSNSCVGASSIFGPNYYYNNMNYTSNVGEIHHHFHHLLSPTSSSSSSSHHHRLPIPVVLPFTSSLLDDSDHNQKHTTAPSS